MAVSFYEDSIGPFGIEETDGFVTRISFGAYRPGNVEIKETPLIKETAQQLKAYFAGRLQRFTIPVAPEGTLFQKKIWELLCMIPYGQTATYGQIAAQAGNPKASRAVGLANNRNPVPILIPCHRVIGSDGKLTGYAGGLEMKQWLLELEQNGIRRRPA